MSFIHQETTPISSEEQGLAGMMSKTSISRRPLQRLNINKTPRKLQSNEKDTVKPKIHPAVVCHRFDETEDNIKSAETSLHSRQEDEIREDTVEISIYRREWEVADADADQDSMWTLKRANPICDSDDEEDHIYESPTKRSRKTLELHDSILKPDEPFVLKNYISFD